MIGLRTSRLIAATALAAFAVAVAGCGGSDKKQGPQIPSADASAMINRLEEAKRRSDPFRCNDLRKDTLPALEQQLKALPNNLDADVRSTLEDGIAHLSQLVDDQCASEQQNTQTETTPTTPTQTQTTPPPTTPTQTTPPPTTPTQTTPTQTTPAPETPGTGGATPGKGNGKPKKDGG